MSKIEVYSKKLGKTVTVKTSSGSCAAAGINVGWMQSGWSKDSSW